MATEPPVRAQVRSRPFGRYFKEIHSYSVLPSTNDLALQEAAAGAPPYRVIVAGYQTKGRGQQGRTWLADPGRSLLLSLTLPTGLPWARPSTWCALVAVTLIDLIKAEAGVNQDAVRLATIKWPNDILVEDRKLAGILIEQSHAVVVGVGLNLNQSASDFQTSALNQATSLSQIFGGQSIDRDRILEVFLGGFEKRLIEMESGDRETLESAWNQGLKLEGTEVLAETTRGTERTFVKKIGFSELVLQSEEGRESRFLPEEIRHLFPIK